MTEHSDLSSVLNHFEISDVESRSQVTDNYLEKISRFYCVKWRLLPSYLTMGDIVVNDVSREHPHRESEQRFYFFKEWKDTRGLEATYRSLINALLEINCRRDAESVCQLLKDQLQQPPSSDNGMQ
jgi:hypothetical protein